MDFFLLIGKSLKKRQRAFTTVSGKRVISVWIPHLWRTVSQLERNIELSVHPTGHFKAIASSKHFYPKTSASRPSKVSGRPRWLFQQLGIASDASWNQAILGLLHLGFFFPWIRQQSMGRLKVLLTGINPLAGHQPDTSSEHQDWCHICWRAAYVPAYAVRVLCAASLRIYDKR